MQARKATVNLTYNGKFAGQAAPYLESLKFVDVASGSSDNASLTFNDRDRKWVGPWFPVKGDIIKPKIITENWNKDGEKTELSCGTLCVDDFSFNGGPVKLTLQALALSSDSGFKATKRSFTYEKTTLKEIAQKVASRSGLALYYEAGTVNLEKVVQDNTEDCTFINSLVTKYGLAMKLFNDRLIIFNEATYEAAAVVATLTEADFEPGWSWNTSTTGSYTGIRYQYANSDKAQVFTVNAGGGDRILTSNESAENLTEATIVALAALNNANKGTTTLKVTLKAAQRIIATSCVEITGLGRLSGKYYVESVEHSVGSGYKMALDLRRLTGRFSKAASYSASVAEESNQQTGSSSATTNVSPTVQRGGTYTLTAAVPGFRSAAEAKAGAAKGGNPTVTVRAGTYYVYNAAQGMLNLSANQNVAGDWINPNI